MQRKVRRGIAGMASCLVCFCALAAEPQPAKDEVAFKIDAPTMAAALIQFTQQSGLQLMFATAGTEQISAPKVEGTLSARAALDQLLQDSGLKYEFVNPHTIFVTARPAQALQHTAMPPDVPSPGTATR